MIKWSKELKNQLRDFTRYLFRERFNFSSFCFLSFLLLFLPGQGYYWQTKSLWRPPKIAAAGVFLPEPSFYPANQAGEPLPFLTAKAFLVLDSSSGVFLAAKNEKERLPLASTTKMMTALVAKEAYGLNQVLTVPDFFVEGHKVDLETGEQITAENLLLALLIASGNDAAEVLALNYPGGKQAFVKEMNQKAKELFLNDTSFVNPTGIDETGHFSTALDLARLTIFALSDPTFARIVSYPAAVITSADGKITHSLNNLNRLLGTVEGVKGVKTGWTKGAGECLVTLVERDNRRLIVVVLGSLDRFGETEKLIDWVFQNFVWANPYSTHSGSMAGT